MAYDLYILPRVRVPSGWLEVRITRGTGTNGSFAMTDEAGGFTAPYDEKTVFQVTAPTGMILEGGIGEFVQRMNNEDGRIELDTMEFSFYDALEVTGEVFTGGVSDGVVVLDFAADGTTFFDGIFSDDALTYHVFVAFYNGDGDRDIFFNGTVDAKEVERDHDHPHKPGTASEQQLAQHVKLTAYPVAGRLKSLTAYDVFTVLYNTFLGVGNPMPDTAPGDICPTDYAPPWYAGATAIDLVWVGNEDETEGVYTTPADWLAALNKLITANYGLYEQGSLDTHEFGYSTALADFPMSTWPVKVKAIIRAIQYLLYGDGSVMPTYTEPTPWFSYKRNRWNGDDDVYVDDVNVIGEDVTYGWDDLCISLNHWFGVHGVDESGDVGFSFHEYPVTWKRDAPASDILRDLCWQFGWFVSWKVSQATGRITLDLRPRRFPAVTLPTAFKLLAGSSHESARQIGKTCVLVKNKGDDTIFKCPSNGDSENGVEIEIPFRTRAFGNLEAPVMPSDRLIYDQNKDVLGQQMFSQRANTDESDLINADSWVYAAHLFIYNNDPDIDSLPVIFGKGIVGIGDHRGMYALRACTEKPPTSEGNGVWTNRDNTLYAAAQYYAREMIGDRTVIDRTYIGITADDGTISSLIPGVESEWRYRDVLRSFKGVELRRNFFSDQTTITHVERPADYAALEDLPVSVTTGGSGGGTSGGSGGSGGGTSGVSNIANVTVQGVSGAGTANVIPAWNTTNSLKNSRSALNGINGILETAGKVADTAPAVYGGSTATGYAQAGVVGASDTGSGVKGVSANGLAGEFTGKLKAATVQITSGASAVGMPLLTTDTAGNAEWGGTVAVPYGGTGRSSLSSGSLLLGNGTSGVAFLDPEDGKIPVGNGAGFAMQAVNGDGTLSAAAALTVTRLQGRAVANTAPTNGHVLTWNSGASQWEPAAIPAGLTLTGTTNRYPIITGASSLGEGRWENGNAAGMIYAASLSGDTHPLVALDSTAASTAQRGIQVVSGAAAAVYAETTGTSGSGYAGHFYKNVAVSLGGPAVLYAEQAHASGNGEALKLKQGGLGELIDSTIRTDGAQFAVNELRLLMKGRNGSMALGAPVLQLAAAAPAGSTPLAGFGASIRTTLADDAGAPAIVTASDILTSWASPTAGATRGRITFLVYDGGGANARECMRLEANSTAATIGFLGAAAVVRQNITGVRTGTLAQLQTVVANLLTGLANLGLITDSTT